MEKNIPQYEIVSYKIQPPVRGNYFGAKPIVGSKYSTRPDQANGPWNKEFWGKTEDEAIANAQRVVEEWIGR